MDASAAAATLLRAWVRREWIETEAGLPAPACIGDVYRIHAAMAADPLAAELGGVVGYKQGGVGAVDGEPCAYGPLFGCGIVPHAAGGGALSHSAFNLFGAEAELAFTFAADLPPQVGGAARSEDEVWAAVRSVAPCVELCGSRHRAAAATPLQRLADASCAGGVALGPATAAGAVDRGALRRAASRLLVNGAVAAEGGGAAATVPFRDPAASVAWCANHLNARGAGVRAGDVVICGATCKTRAFAAGDTVTADFGGALGAATVCVTA